MKTINKIVALQAFQNKQDHECCLLAALGYSNKLIRQRTGLTDCQIHYRLQRVKVKRKDYRDGKSELSKLVSNKIHNMASNVIEEKIRKLLPVR